MKSLGVHYVTIAEKQCILGYIGIIYGTEELHESYCKMHTAPKATPCIPTRPSKNSPATSGFEVLLWVWDFALKMTGAFAGTASPGHITS